MLPWTVKISFVCVNRQTSEGTSYEQPVPGAQEGRAMVAPPPSHATRAIWRQLATAEINIWVSNMLQSILCAT
jgi:hypothetical protein